ncbi:Bacteriophage lambda head decoration protein D [Paenibacillus sophorae]|uniref:Head decoration protein n=1 Tax=Paenibacillus sophorae TaxID=1333845 RepID=A0A1H8L8A1_9BACL|nr:head decoration protein [Paenibacillus sophorae]QWU17387.1 head decoration protein [Paenibacillus sophorae]SEO01410.1 Bacteriophage lambda head decoration protein D [Paenibacillus sophorae]
MNLQPRQRVTVQDEYEILASFEVIREVANGITIDSAAITADGNGDKIIKKGMPMAKLTASGKYVPYNSAGADGSQNPTAILKRTVNVKDGDHVVGGYEVAKIIAARVPVTVDATLRSKMPNIVFA